MDKSDFYIGNEGGLSHLWATTKKNGIVFFGHWIPPYLTGYSFHLNLSIRDNKHCGSLSPCEECLNFYKNLSPDYIKYLLDKLILVSNTKFKTTIILKTCCKRIIKFLNLPLK